MPDQMNETMKSPKCVDVDHDRRDCAHYTWTDGHEHADAPRLDAWSVTPNSFLLRPCRIAPGMSLVRQREVFSICWPSSNE
jgi:hypothetical protein